MSNTEKAILVLKVLDAFARHNFKAIDETIDWVIRSQNDGSELFSQIRSWCNPLTGCVSQEMTIYPILKVKVLPLSAGDFREYVLYIYEREDFDDGHFSTDSWKKVLSISTD